MPSSLPLRPELPINNIKKEEKTVKRDTTANKTTQLASRPQASAMGANATKTATKMMSSNKRPKSTKQAKQTAASAGNERRPSDEDVPTMSVQDLKGMLAKGWGYFNKTTSEK
ncbi:hypothetical protein N0V90_006238 [Kalmusia sp. IMI 367209]|nr:hypothetical protein N0V90_006238 [Kalmusia sp. IMI 367209]